MGNGILSSGQLVAKGFGKDDDPIQRIGPFVLSIESSEVLVVDWVPCGLACTIWCYEDLLTINTVQIVLRHETSNIVGQIRRIIAARSRLY